MYSTLKTLSMFAIVGTALAVPAAHEKRRYWGNWGQNGYWSGSSSSSAVAQVQTSASPVVTVAPTTTTAVVVTTATATATYGQEQYGGQFHSSAFAAPSSAAAAPAAAASSAAPQAASGSAPAANADYMTIVNYYRQAMGKSALSQDSTLEANALKTTTDDQGTMSHELNPGSMAQVLAPGDQSEFLHCFVGGWLCERPDLLDSISPNPCNVQSAGWSYDGTGHADILSSTSYSKIGCAWDDGIWGCDLA